MTHLEVIKLLLSELKRGDPAQYQHAVAELLATLGYVDPPDAGADPFEDPYPIRRTLH